VRSCSHASPEAGCGGLGGQAWGYEAGRQGHDAVIAGGNGQDKHDVLEMGPFHPMDLRLRGQVSASKQDMTVANEPLYQKLQLMPALRRFRMERRGLGASLPHLTSLSSSSQCASAKS
jgi:hypothetical protein